VVPGRAGAAHAFRAAPRGCVTRRSGAVPDLPHGLPGLIKESSREVPAGGLPGRTHRARPLSTRFEPVHVIKDVITPVPRKTHRRMAVLPARPHGKPAERRRRHPQPRHRRIPQPWVRQLRPRPPLLRARRLGHPHPLRIHLKQAPGTPSHITQNTPRPWLQVSPRRPPAAVLGWIQQHIASCLANGPLIACSL
jgi:hypothetical protein